MPALPQRLVVLLLAKVSAQSEIDGAEREVYVVESGDDFVNQFHSGSLQRVIDNVIHVTQIGYTWPLIRSSIL